MSDNKENEGVKPVKKTGNEKRAQNKPKPWSKVIIRRLPPTMTEATFLDQIQPIPDHDFMYFVPADRRSLGINATSRCYINFLRQEDIFIFKEKFDSYVFVDERGNEYPAVVEFAPFQKLTKHKSRRKDKKCNTYEKSEHFQKFLEFINNEDTDMPKLELKLDFDNKEDNQVRSTPLLEYLNTKRSDRSNRRKEFSKKMPATIPEDGVVTVIKNKFKDRGGKPESGEKGAQKGQTGDKPERSEKEKARRAERDKLRREKRNQKFEEKRKERQLAKEKDKLSGENKNPEELHQQLDNPDVKRIEINPDKSNREIKRYSEKRQQKQKKFDSMFSKTEGNSSAENPGGENQPEKKRSDRRNDDKRRVRNKDRPSLQIYQPGKGGGKLRNPKGDKEENPKSNESPEMKSEN